MEVKYIIENTHRFVVDVVNAAVKDGRAVSKGRDVTRVGRVQLGRRGRGQGGL